MQKKILVIDDNCDILEAVTYLLSDMGYNVIAKDNGKFAEKLKKPNLPDLIILDILLSGKDGRDITKILKNKSDTKKIPIILISAHPEVEQSAFACGANDFIAKPFEVETLIEKIDKCLN